MFLLLVATISSLEKARGQENKQAQNDHRIPTRLNAGYDFFEKGEQVIHVALRNVVRKTVFPSRHRRINA